MLGGDREDISESRIVEFASSVKNRLVAMLSEAVKRVFNQQRTPRQLRTFVVSGEGEFLARLAAEHAFGTPPAEQIVSLNDILGSTVSACAPAYALAVLATERPSS